MGCVYRKKVLAMLYLRNFPANVLHIIFISHSKFTVRRGSLCRSLSLNQTPFLNGSHMQSLESLSRTARSSTGQ